MSYENRYSNAITITPALTAAEIRRAPGGKGAGVAWDAHLRIAATIEQVHDGEVTRYTADAIVGPEQPCSGYELVAQIQALVDLYADGHEFGGFIQVDWDPGFEQLPVRYVVRDGRVETVKPTLAWPDGGA